MGEMASLWGYAEHQDMDQLGQKLLCTTLELEKLKSETIEEVQKNKNYVNQLILMLKCAIQERDEARNQLEKIINKTTFPHFQSPKPNSSITESNSLSETYNYSSPPIESLFDPHVSSPDFFHQESNNFSPMINQGPLIHQESNNFSPKESLIMDSLAKGKALPQKGMYLQAVLESGPLLQTLLLAGPLPRWRNPPRLLQPFQIPAVSIRGCYAENSGQKPTSSVYAFGSVRNNGSFMSSGVGNNDCFQLGKRQRFC